MFSGKMVINWNNNDAGFLGEWPNEWYIGHQKTISFTTICLVIYFIFLVLPQNEILPSKEILTRKEIEPACQDSAWSEKGWIMYYVTINNYVI